MFLMKLFRVIVVHSKLERSILPTYLTVLTVAVPAANPVASKSSRVTAGTVFMVIDKLDGGGSYFTHFVYG